MTSTKNTRKRTKKRTSTAKKTTRSRRTKQQTEMRNEIVVLISLAICIFLQLSLFGICGDAGDALAMVLFGMFGFMAYITPILLFIGIAFLSQNKYNKEAYIKTGTFYPI